MCLEDVNVWRRVKICVVSFVMVSVFFGQFLFVPETAGSWSNEGDLSSDDGNPSMYPEVSLACENDGNGNDNCKNIHVVWVEEHTYDDPPNNPTCQAIMYKRSTDYGATWGTTIPISNPHYLPGKTYCGDAGKPSISVEGSSIYVIWPNVWDFYTNDADPLRYYRIYFQRSLNGGGTWAATDIAIDDTTVVSSRTVSRIIARYDEAFVIGTSVYGGSDYLHAVWETYFTETTPIENSIRYDRAAAGSPGSWGTDQLISKHTSSADGEDPDVAAYGDGDYVHVVFKDQDPYDGLYYQRNANDGASGDWYANPAPLTPRYVADPEYPSISVTEKYVHITWEDSRFSVDSSYIYYLRSRDNGGSWDSPGQRLSEDSTSGTAGSWTSIAIDGNGDVHMSYRDATDSHLKYSKNGVTPVTVDDEGDTGLWNSLATDSNNKVHISYYDATNGRLRYAENTGGSWKLETVDDSADVGQYSSIALESDNTPHISYLDATYGNLRHAVRSGGWTKTTVDSDGYVGYYTSIAMYDDDPSISYYDLTNGNLKYAKLRSGSWGTRLAVDTDGDVGLYTSLAMESGDDYAHISYFDATNGKLKYAWCTTGSDCYSILNWDNEDVHDDTYNSVGSWTSIAFDSNGIPHISYYDETDGNLLHSWWIGCRWCFEIVDYPGDVGKYSSIAIDSSDNIHISYYDDTNNDLKYAKKTTTGWTLSSLEDVGEDYEMISIYATTSIALDSNDNPHIAFHDINGNNPKYGYDTGSGWGSTKLETGNSKNGNWISLALDSSDGVHIAYYNSAYHLEYAFCNSGGCDAPGDFSKTTVDSGTTTGQWNSIAVLSTDKPCISYFDDSNDDLRYAEYDTSWASTAVDSTNFVGQYTSLAIDDNDYRHISYLSVTGANLKYAKCKGTCTTSGNWGIATPDSANIVGLHTSIAIDDNDYPHISYMDGTYGSEALKRAQCTEDECWSDDDWEAEIVHHDVDGPIGTFTSIELDSNNNPHISYYDPTDHNVWYAEKTGASWNKEPVDTACDVGKYTSIDLDGSNKAYVSYHDDTDTDAMYAKRDGTAWTDWTFTVVDNTAGDAPTRDRYHKTPTIDSVGATVHVAWALDYYHGSPTCRACSIRFDRNMDNGDSGEWGTDGGIYPEAWPIPPVDILPALPVIAASGNDLHVVFMDLGTHASKVFEVQYAKSVDTISETGTGTLDYPLKGTATVYALLNGDIPDWGYRIFIIGGEKTSGGSDIVYMQNPASSSDPTFYCDLQVTGDQLSYASAIWDQDNDMIYVFGGKTATGVSEKIYKIDLTNPATNKCQYSGDDLNSGGLYGTSAVFDADDGYAYIFGGYDGSSFETMIQRYDTSGGDAYDTSCDLPSGRAFTSAVIDESSEKAYIFGGLGASSARYDDILEFDVGSPGNPTNLDTDLPTARDGTSAAFDGTYAYVFGGEDDTDGLLDEIVRFNPTHDSTSGDYWDVGKKVMCKKLPAEIRDTSATATINAHSVAGNGIRIVGGDKGGGTYSDKITKYEISYWGPG